MNCAKYFSLEPPKPPSISHDDIRSIKSQIKEVLEDNVYKGFEGPEKKIEFILSGNFSLREISNEDWQSYLDIVGVKILSNKKSKDLTAFVLSESSLFVYDNVVVLKTCGTTTLLKFIPTMEEICLKYGKEIEFVIYSRKNFTFPQLQKEPHQSVDMEKDLLEKKFGNDMYILGSEEKDHWLIFTWENKDIKSKEEYQFMEIKMHELDPIKMLKYFEKNQNDDDRKCFNKTQGLDKILETKKAIYDEHLFEGCGYSMNCIHDDCYYSTIHVTPEINCSYVSYETNYPLSYEGRQELIKKVLKVYDPASYSITYFTRQGHNKEDQLNIEKKCLEGKVTYIKKDEYEIIHESHLNKEHILYPLYVKRIITSTSFMNENFSIVPEKELLIC